MSVCVSDRMEQLGFHWTDFHEIWYLSTFRKSIEKLQVSLNSDRNNGYFALRPRRNYDDTRLEREMFHTKVVQKTKLTYYVQYFFFLRKSCRLWDNVNKHYRAEPATDDSVVQAHCMLDTLVYKHTLRICFSTAAMVARKRPNVTLYVLYVCLSKPGCSNQRKFSFLLWRVRPFFYLLWKKFQWNVA